MMSVPSKPKLPRWQRQSVWLLVSAQDSSISFYLPEPQGSVYHVTDDAVELRRGPVVELLDFFPSLALNSHHQSEVFGFLAIHLVGW